MYNLLILFAMMIGATTVAWAFMSLTVWFAQLTFPSK